ncbi:substrate-binding domain-containing protein [Kineococcus arenarius]|uniref:substrate-binding domain-containing protein n=1 Tax=unclassified Kineococcus TaxID=2621656 RepID=UPI003D7D56B6
MLKKSFALVLVGATLVLTACSGGADAAEGEGEGKRSVGIAMPTTSSTRWLSDGASMVDLFEAAGYTTDLQYGEDDVDSQVSQIRGMIEDGVSLLVVAAIDGQQLTGVLQQAEDAQIPVIAYDRLVVGSEAVDYYASFDNLEVGRLQAQHLVDALVPDPASPKTIELFAGSPDDNNSYAFLDGAMEVLQPHLDSGALVVRSGQTSMDQISTERWDGATAASRLESVLAANYSGTRLDAVLSPYDGMSRAIIAALQAHGYGSSQPLPVVTGQDAELESVRSIIAGEQSQTVFKDTRELARATVQMSEAVLAGEEPVTTTVSDNDVKEVPADLLEPVGVDASNVQQVLVDSGYYTAEQLAG